ncbi:leucine--tRNA ligase [Malacoplasma iowae]|uniref:Leucine--tRNA ligase n=1 Tax=Malacoplasma iowae 695 TaxID=1048830 RepID=A0A6P1LBN9_MALIO|nr:leucine--tRNA ligase [Malacoplasma iowae]VEU63271.1 Leucine--tRNA ligase [Mycoplasmopsis fermentans]EGZ31217.1 leucyl-tRNA synthetase [Malacoplasma iowae 695]QHG89607.1 leucine--tRNA ligase [Malacoplasma iowae 695]WPL35614.1 leucine--tRNA ligase [Malacoplasma iowae]VEU72000.1 Leucine--tRNA ligase [Malacoplasma iowae]
MYNHSLIEKKWSKYWKENKTFKFHDDIKNDKKFYVLDMFPYPSGSGLHVGHGKGYTFTDVIARYKRFQGFNVLHPIGWDAFGLPAEQYALDTGNHPESFTMKNIDNFRNQLQMFGFSYDYDKEVNTIDPKYYQWTQWIFIQLYKKGLAEIKDVDVNWCEALGTVLANEEVLTDENGNKVSERGKHPVVKKPMKQWVLKITEYADRLIDDLDLTDWNLGLKNIQTSWIGRTNGASIKFQVLNSKDIIEVFTSRPDTIFGVSFIGLSIDHEIVKQKAIKDQNVQKYINSVNSLKEYERNKDEAEKTGVFLDLYAIHPITKKQIPIYVTNYVLSNYGNGAVMGVPAHDLRDFLFAKKYGCEIIKVVDSEQDCYQEDGKHINSDFLNDLNINQATETIIKYLEKNKIGKSKTNYKLKDWLFSRQRYWGEPFPVLFDNNGNILLEDNLPLKLPKTDNIKPSGDGKSPLANLTDWVNVKIGNKLYQRETNTMPQWAGSCWYFLGYLLKQDNGEYIPLNSKEAFDIFKRWMPIDLYVGGQEHAVLHLLYARFWYKFLYDIKVVPNKEPFFKLVNQGMILGSDGEKMSKSKGNVVNPIDVIKLYGADSLRLYELFMGPITASLEWNDNGLAGMNKWINRVYRMFDTKKIDDKENKELELAYIKFVSKITKQIENYETNLAISEMMIFVNECYKYETLNAKIMEGFVTILSCFTPFICEEINEVFLKNKNSITKNKWPIVDESKIVVSEINIPVQINGKVRDVINIKIDQEEKEILNQALNTTKIKQLIENKEIVKTIYVKNKIVNLIIK